VKTADNPNESAQGAQGALNSSTLTGTNVYAFGSHSAASEFGVQKQAELVTYRASEAVVGVEHEEFVNFIDGPKNDENGQPCQGTDDMIAFQSNSTVLS
jgi:hypothetical protein